jgi:transcriptional antiterminator NusG
LGVVGTKMAEEENPDENVFDLKEDKKENADLETSEEQEKIIIKTPKKEKKESREEAVENGETKPIIFVVKVTTNKEEKALDMIAEKVMKKKINIYSIARPHGLRGYIFLESPDRENAEEAIFNLPYIKGILPKLLSYEDVKTMLEPVASEIKIEKNDIVELIAEPFKKEKAKVVRVDKAKGEAVVSLLGATVPIPVRVKLDNIRVIRRESGEEIQEGKE